ncbi:hypothetical protein LTS15_005721 [Exophiala xenobiotica]|nr:hypothetical protein LTS15_005721 [Exophiala xenobiotica]
MSAGPSKSLIDRLISPGGQVRYDRSSGRLRPVNPIIALHQLGDLRPGFATGNSREKDRRVDRLLRELNPETHDHLMECFWLYYDPVMQVVGRKLFEEDRRSGGGLTYSGFLHLCILAMGYRYADPKRADIQKLTLRDKESTLHREAKYLVELEFEEPGGIPSVQALLILGQLESGSGRDGVGWIYAGVAFRYAFDLGLNLDYSTLNLTQREREFRKFVLRACTAFDKLWAIYLGRLTTIKSSDLSPHVYLDRGPKVHEDELEAAIVFEKNMDNQCFDALLGLLDISAKVVEYLYSRQSILNHSDFLVIGSLDSDLENWYNRLPSNLAWTPLNIETAPLSYFHLHLATMSRAVCMKHTSEMVRILSRQYQRFDPYRAPQGQLQHIGTAAAALISAAAVSEDPQERLRLLESLHNLADLTRAISPTYMAAEAICNLLDNLFKEPGWGYDSASGSDNAEGPSDTANKKLRLDDDIIKSPPSLPSREVYGHHSSYASLDDDFSYTLGPQETMETLSRLSKGDLDMTGSNGMASTSMGLLSPNLQEADGHDKFPQFSWAPLTSWAVPSFSLGDRPGNSFTIEHFPNSDSNYETML